MIAEIQTAISNTPARRRVDQRLTTADKVKIRAERMALLIRGAPVEIGLGLIAAAITIAVAWPNVDHNVLKIWGGLAFGLGFIRFAVWLRYSKTPAAHALADYAKLHIGGMGLNGAVWGALGPIFAMHGMLGDAFLPFMIAAMTAIALAAAGASWRAVLAFTIPALAPFALAYVFAVGAYGPIFALVVAVFAGAVAYLAWSTQEMIARSIRLRSRNDRLLETLKKEVAAAHETEKRYRGLVESSQDLTLIFSPEGRVVYASASATAALGVAPEGLIGASTRDIVHPDDLPHFRSVGEKSLSTIGEVVPLPHVCLKVADGAYAAFTGRLTNMLYVPGVDGFVFTGGRVGAEERDLLHAAE